jgi:hypothetical protein
MHKTKHELYQKFDEDHEYVVLLCVGWIFTELLSEMRKPEVEKKAIFQNSNKWALLVVSLSSVFTKNCLTASADKCFRDVQSNSK